MTRCRWLIIKDSRVRIILASITVLIWLIFFAMQVQAQGAAAEAYEIFNRVNAYRATRGVHAFTLNTQLMAAAADQIDYLTSTGNYTHDGWGGSRPAGRARAAGYSGAVSEVFVAGGGTTPASGLTWWQNSPVHHNIITSNRYTQVGVAYGYAFEQHWYVMVVGVPSATPTPTFVPIPTRPAFSQLLPNGDDEPATPEVEPMIVVEEYIPPPIVVKPITLSTPEPDGSIWHTLEQGQAIWTLSAYYNIDVSVLLAINNLGANEFVMPGDQIRIRLADDSVQPTPQPTATRPAEHITRDGESLWTIAGQYGLNIAELLRINGFSENKMIWAGDKIRLKLLAGESYPIIITVPPPTFHNTVEGESLWVIAANYGLTFDELLRLNGLAQTKMIWPGDQVRIRLAEGEDYPLIGTPKPTATPVVTQTPVTFYRVQEGQLLYEIAYINKVPLNDLMAWNKLDIDSLIYEGEDLLVVPPTVIPAATQPTEPIEQIGQLPTQEIIAVETPLSEQLTNTPPPAPTIAAMEIIETAEDQSTLTPYPLSVISLLLIVGLLLAGALTRLTSDLT